MSYQLRLATGKTVPLGTTLEALAGLRTIAVAAGPEAPAYRVLFAALGPDERPIDRETWQRAGRQARRLVAQHGYRLTPHARWMLDQVIAASPIAEPAEAPA